MPVLPPLPADRWDDKARFAFAGLLPRERQNPEGAGTALATLARHPDLTKAFIGFSVHLLYRSTVPARLRELAILRVAYRRDCLYELTHHRELGREVGLSEDEIASAQRGEAVDDFEQKLLAAVDELDETSRLSERTWAALGERLDERQQMDLVFTIGGYTMMAMAFNTFGIELEQER